MRSQQQPRSSLSRTISRTATAALVTTVVLAAVASTQSALAQTFKVIYNFTGAADGAWPLAGLTIDQAGNLYGTTNSDANGSTGAVFELERTDSAWVESTLYKFMGRPDGSTPFARVIFGSDGSLYGTTVDGGVGCSDRGGCGTVFRLQRAQEAHTSGSSLWTETVLYRFQGGADGFTPYSEVVFDGAGNIYGTTAYGGKQDNGVGTVYKLVPEGSGWAKSMLWAFVDGGGWWPFGSVVLDQYGNIYGTAEAGGFGCDWHHVGCGTIYQLTPSAGGWMLNLLHTFRGGPDGGLPVAGLIFDQYGNLYGTSEGEGLYGGRIGPGSGGSVFKMSPSTGWSFSALQSFVMLPQGCWEGPGGSLTMDPAGNLYGTTVCGGANGYGNVFKLTRSKDGWTYSSLHDFLGGADGWASNSNVVFDGNGNTYGITSEGGTYGYGTVWEITP